MSKLLQPAEGSIIYEDDKLYCCLASYPITKGHTLIVWKEEVADLHLLGKGDYEYLMECVDKARNAILKTLGVEKVYLMYLDEANQVHWHLIPRYKKMGYNILAHKPKRITDFSLAKDIKNSWPL